MTKKASARQSFQLKKYYSSQLKDFHDYPLFFGIIVFRWVWSTIFHDQRPSVPPLHVSSFFWTEQISTEFWNITLKVSLSILLIRYCSVCKCSTLPTPCLIYRSMRVGCGLLENVFDSCNGVVYCYWLNPNHPYLNPFIHYSYLQLAVWTTGRGV